MYSAPACATLSGIFSAIWKALSTFDRLARDTNINVHVQLQSGCARAPSGHLMRQPNKFCACRRARTCCWVAR